MLTRTLATLIVVLALAGGASAWQPPPAQQPPEKPAPKAPSAPMARHNVKLDVTILDQAGDAEPARKTVSLILADRRKGMIRSGGNVLVAGNRVDVMLNVDARPSIMDDKRIDLDLGLEYAPKPVSENETNGERRAHLSERLVLILEPGKPMVVSHASDPISNRRITVELTATILK